ncbi:MAG: hypothetical protein MJ198_07885 [Bacteroidales bacterium]|nr:hypothetical protein [Bacteroidales bacterium]
MEKRQKTYVKLPRKLKKAFRTDFIPKRYYRCRNLVDCYAKYPTPKALKYIHAYVMRRDSIRLNCSPDELYKKYGFYTKEMLEDYYEIMNKTRCVLVKK